MAPIQNYSLHPCIALLTFQHGFLINTLVPALENNLIITLVIAVKTILLVSFLACKKCLHIKLSFRMMFINNQLYVP